MPESCLHLLFFNTQEASYDSSPSCGSTLQLEGNLGTWLAILEHLYAAQDGAAIEGPQQQQQQQLQLSGPPGSVFSMLPVLHKYDIHCLMEACLNHLSAALPDRLSPHPGSEGFIIRWLGLAEELQLDELKEVGRFTRGFCLVVG